MDECNRSSRWLFPEEDLRSTPSVRAGISLEQELTFRQKQAMLIQTIGLKSGLTQLAVNTSVIFMHRFFMYRTVKAFPRVQLAIGFAFAGGKVEESARKLEHLIRTAVEVIRSNKNREFLDRSDPLTYEMDCQWRSTMEVLCQSGCSTDSPAYLEMRKLVLECETEIYAVIGFQLQIVHPHNYVIRMCALLGAENIKDISQYAYNLATASSQLTMLCLKYRPETIATMCLNIASKAHSIRFEPMKDTDVKWYQVIVPTTDFAEIEAVSEEFLHLIKGCPLLPSWMTNLARMSRVNNRPMAGAARGPNASSASAAPGSRQSQSGTAAAAPAGSVPPPQQHSSSQSHSGRPVQQGNDLPTSQQNSASASGPQPQPDAVTSPHNRQGSGEGGSSSSSAAVDAYSREAIGHPSSHSRSSHTQGGGSLMRPPQSTSTAASHHHNHQQHRPHPTSGGRPSGSGAPTSGNGRPPAKTAHLPSGASQHVPSNRSSSSSQNIPVSHHSSHQSSRAPHDSSRPHHDLPRPPHDPSRPHDQSRSDVSRLSHDPSRSRDPSRAQDPGRSQDPSRSSRLDRRPDPSADGRRPASHALQRDDSLSSRSQPSRSTVEPSSQRPKELSPRTPPPPTTSPPAIKPPSPPELPTPQVSDPVPASGDAPELRDSGNRNSSSPENKPHLNLDVNKQRQPSNPAPKLSLSMYRERASARSRAPMEPGASIEDANTTLGASNDAFVSEPKLEQTTNSPADRGMKHSGSTSDLSNFTKPMDSPNNPRIKIKVKRDPSSGERHSVKYADNGLKIKIKPIRSETSTGPEEEAGPSGLGPSSHSSTPREEGEIVDDTPSSERRSEPLRIRLSVPKSDGGSSYSRRDSDQGSNGYSGDRDSGHRSHHHGHHHHRSHHSHKSKKHSSKHDRSRHEGKSSKRSSSALEYYDERPSKTSRTDTYLGSTSSGDLAHRSFDSMSHNSSSRNLQHQNSGFSISDAFSSVMPHNIFDDDEDDAGHTHPPITPTVDAAIPPHHEHFHQLLAQHRANEAKKPPLPKGPPPPASPPPPPPSPPTL